MFLRKAEERMSLFNEKDHGPSLRRTELRRHSPKYRFPCGKSNVQVFFAKSVNRQSILTTPSQSVGKVFR